MVTKSLRVSLVQGSSFTVCLPTSIYLVIYYVGVDNRLEVLLSMKGFLCYKKIYT